VSQHAAACYKVLQYEAACVKICNRSAVEDLFKVVAHTHTSYVVLRCVLAGCSELQHV